MVLATPALRRLGVACFAACALQLGYAADAPFDAAFAQFQHALNGDAAAAERAAAQFAALASAQPSDPALLAYAGAATALKARSTLLPWRKIAHAENGLEQIDDALARLQPAHDQVRRNDVPVSLHTRFTAANTFLGLPGFFNREARGAKLLDDVLRDPSFGSAALRFRGAVWLRAARHAAKTGRPHDARRWLDALLDSGAPQADDAQALRRQLQP